MSFTAVRSAHRVSRHRARLAAVATLVTIVLFGCDGTAGPQVEAPTPVELEIPSTFPLPELPADNPLTEEGIRLGRMLFFDPILSVDSTVACASCHAPESGFSDPNPFSQGVAGFTGRHSMPVVNVAWMKTLFWDGRAVSVEDQALQPVQNHVEMGETWEHVIEKLRRHPDYPALFEAAFPGADISADEAAKAIAQFERTLISADSRYDRFLRQEAELTDQERLGLSLFNTERGDCFHCHGTALFTDNRFHNNGLDAVSVDRGLASVTGNDFDRGKFKTPTLRNVEYTAPYMHDGRFETLEEVVEFYFTEVQASETLDPLLTGPRPDLTEEEKAALVAFMKTLSDPGFLAQ